MSRNDVWEDTRASYSEFTIGSVIEGLGLEIESETHNDFLLNCPFHGGTRDPSMTVSKSSNVFFCHNPACNEVGDLMKLVQFVKDCNFFVAQRFISQFKETDSAAFTKTLTKQLAHKEMPTFDPSVIDRMHKDLMDNPAALQYCYTRGFNDQSIEDFKLGYSSKQELIATPMHDYLGNPVGVIGRTIEGKRFKNSIGLPTSQTLFNIHRAKRAGDSVVFVESNFDAIRVHQAGFPCVVASLGGALGQAKLEQLDKYFKKIIILTDQDAPQFHKNCRKCINAGSFACTGHRPGLELGRKIEKELSNKLVYWAHSGGEKRLFAKDAGEMTDEQIKICIENKVSRLEARSFTW